MMRAHLKISLSSIFHNGPKETEVLVLGGSAWGGWGAGGWRGAAPLPARRCRAGLARVRDNVYAVGGFNGSLRVRSVDVYNAAADTWSSGPPLCARRSTLGVAALGDVIYAVGGFDGVTGLSSAEMLDTSSSEPAWRSIASMSTRRSSVGVCILHGYLYAVGGYDGASRQCLHTVERVAFKAQRACPVLQTEVLVLGGSAWGGWGAGGWRGAAPLPARRCRAGLARVRDNVYAVGGFNGSLRVRSVDVYNAAADTWSGGPPLCARRSTLGVAALGDVIYAVGGFDGVTGLSSAEMLDTSSSEPAWRSIASMSTRRSSVGVCILHGYLYAVGGYDGASRQCLHTVERYDPALDKWEPVAPMSARRSGAGVGAVGGALYAVGGHDGPAVRRSVERLRPAPHAPADEDCWSPAPPMHTARRNAAVAAHRGKLIVLGGDDGAANLDTGEIFDPATEQWTMLSERMSVGRSYAGVCVVEWPA
ncbi:hypothetical protein evm_012644 [Chilo suppressalis]|nr:hypothetical protein evm_012644 [Chilo suppressalis]